MTVNGGCRYSAKILTYRLRERSFAPHGLGCRVSEHACRRSGVCRQPRLHCRSMSGCDRRLTAKNLEQRLPEFLLAEWFPEARRVA